MSLSFFAIYTNTQAVTQDSLRETSAGATRTWSPECEARKDLSERNESHTCLLADPKGEHAKAGEEFRTQPKISVIFNHTCFFKNFLDIFLIFLKEYIVLIEFLFSVFVINIGKSTIFPSFLYVVIL